VGISVGIGIKLTITPFELYREFSSLMIYSLLAPFFVIVAIVWGGVALWQADRTFYAVTTRRILIQSGMLNRQWRSVDLLTISNLQLVRQSEGTGTIYFTLTKPGTMFRAINEVGEVYNIIKSAQWQRYRAGTRPTSSSHPS
jgi:hypothetical protein